MHDLTRAGVDPRLKHGRDGTRHNEHLSFTLSDKHVAAIVEPEAIVHAPRTGIRIGIFHIGDGGV